MAPQNLIFAAVGGVWLDEIRTKDSEPLIDVPGGSVAFATLGARLFATKEPSIIAMSLRTGHDFPKHIIETFRSWQTNLTILEEPDLPSARGIINMGDSDGPRAYERLTEPLNISAADLAATHVTLPSILHCFDTPEGLQKQLDEDGVVKGRFIWQNAPIFIWEPQVDACKPEMITAHLSAADQVEVISPNHSELAKLFGLDPSFDKDRTEMAASIFVNHGIGRGQGCIVVRAGEHGCLLMSGHVPPIWLPTCHESTSEKVVNTTGAGNAFLGGFAIGCHETHCWFKAAQYGQVAASFAIEQVGLPTLQSENDGHPETWNGESVRERLAEYMERTDHLARVPFGPRPFARQETR